MKSTERLTDAKVRALPVPAKTRIHYDAEVGGFGCRVTPGGARSYILTYWTGGRQRRITIGGASEWKAASARRFAAGMKARVRLGEDPLANLEAGRSAPVMSDLCDRFEQEQFGRLRPASVKLYRLAIEGSRNDRGIRGHFRSRKVADLSHMEIEAWHRKLSENTPTMANRSLAVLSRMFSLAIKRGWRADNPAKGIERNRETKRTRYLSPAEIGRLTTVLSAMTDRQAADIFRLLLLTGARKGEVLAMRWDQIDMERGLWIKPGSATKQRTEHRAPLSAPALQLLAGLGRMGVWVFPGKGGDGHRTEVKGQWAKVAAAAALEGVRMHDLRHTYASVLASAGLSLPIIGALLGHSQPATTARYAHLMDDPLRAATERVGAVVTGSNAAEVVSMEDRR